MSFKLEPIAINSTTIETGLWHIQRYLMQRYRDGKKFQPVKSIAGDK